jgi:hypothetical protein
MKIVEKVGTYKNIVIMVCHTLYIITWQYILIFCMHVCIHICLPFNTPILSSQGLQSTSHPLYPGFAALTVIL